jgi:hypothetical protein
MEQSLQRWEAIQRSVNEWWVSEIGAVCVFEWRRLTAGTQAHRGRRMITKAIDGLVGHDCAAKVAHVHIGDIKDCEVSSDIMATAA